MNEALEEAGLHGQVVGEPLGAYEDTKWGAMLRVTVLMMEVTGCDDKWLEADVRERRWVSPEHASELLSKPILRQFVDTAVRRILKTQNLAAFFLTNSCTLRGSCPVSVNTSSDIRS